MLKALDSGQWALGSYGSSARCKNCPALYFGNFRFGVTISVNKSSVCRVMEDTFAGTFLTIANGSLTSLEEFFEYVKDIGQTLIIDAGIAADEECLVHNNVRVGKRAHGSVHDILKSRLA